MEIKWAIQCLESISFKLTMRQQEAVQTLKSAVLAQQATNMPSTPCLYAGKCELSSNVRCRDVNCNSLS
jgi:hypothetical protein